MITAKLFQLSLFLFGSAMTSGEIACWINPNCVAGILHPAKPLHSVHSCTVKITLLYSGSLKQHFLHDQRSVLGLISLMFDQAGAIFDWKLRAKLRIIWYCHIYISFGSKPLYLNNTLICSKLAKEMVVVCCNFIDWNVGAQSDEQWQPKLIVSKPNQTSRVDQVGI